MKNKYLKHTHISERKTRELIRYFSLDVEAKKTTELTGLSYGAVNRFYDKLRDRIVELCEAESPFTTGEVEFDESYVGARQVRGIRGCGARGEIPVFGVLTRGDKVYTKIVKSGSGSLLLPHIQGRDDTDAVLCTDGFGASHSLVDLGCRKRYRAKHEENESANGHNPINGIENFWGVCKVRLSKFRGIHKHKFYLHIKECEFRYNYKNQDIYKLLLKNIRESPLKGKNMLSCGRLFT